jgi:hypothetical protein
MNETTNNDKPQKDVEYYKRLLEATNTLWSLTLDLESGRILPSDLGEDILKDLIRLLSTSK